MALATKPADFADGNVLTAAQLNALLTLLAIFGYTTISGGTGEGTIDDANVKTGAALNKSKIGDTAMVCSNTISAGTQFVTRPTDFTALMTQRFANIGTNTETLAAAAALAINPAPLYHFITVGTGTITTITGATVEGTRLILVLTGAITLTNSAADTLNSLHINGVTGAAPANYVATGATALAPHFKQFVYTKLGTAFANFQWVEIPW